jgi:hypothetical protein
VLLDITSLNGLWSCAESANEKRALVDTTILSPLASPVGFCYPMKNETKDFVTDPVVLLLTTKSWGNDREKIPNNN